MPDKMGVAVWCKVCKRLDYGAHTHDKITEFQGKYRFLRVSQTKRTKD